MTNRTITPLLLRLDGWLSRDRLWRYPTALLLATVAIYGVTLARSSRWIEPTGRIVGHDFFAFYMAGDLVRSGLAADLYNVEAQTAWQRRFMQPINPHWEGVCLYLNPPHYAWAMSWLAPLGYGGALIAWWTLSLACFAASALIWRRWLAHDDFPLTVLLATCMPAWFQALAGGQNSFFTLLILTGFCDLILRGREVAAGLVLSLLAFKFHLLLVPAGLLLAKRRWRAAGGLVAGGAATLLLTVVLMGPRVVTDYLAFGSQLGSLMQHEGFDAFKQHSWYGLLHMAGAGWMPTGAVRMLTAAASIATLALLAWIWRGPSRPDTPHLPLQLAALVVATALTSPHLFHYDMLILVLPAVLWRMASRDALFAPWRPAVNVLLAGGFLWLAIGGLLADALRLQLSPILAVLFLVVIARAVRATAGQAAPDAPSSPLVPVQNLG